LGALTLRWRTALKAGGHVDLRGKLPPSVRIVYADNVAERWRDFRASKTDREAIDAFEKEQESLLVLTHFNDTAMSLRSFFYRRIPIWEGHTRPALDRLVADTVAANRDPAKLAMGVSAFLAEVAKGFTRSAFGDTFEEEIREGCTRTRRGQPKAIQELARLLVSEPDHRGVAKVLRRVAEYRDQGKAFKDVAFDLPSEYWDAVRLGDFEMPDDGLAEIKHRRSYTYPQPPPRSISTIHKAKGLECKSAIVVPCDAKVFPDKLESRCLLYVALSRATEHLVLVIPRHDPSPLLQV
jgi:DNA helicase-2/ATP-dependent DNA helicase PcrA